MIAKIALVIISLSCVYAQTVSDTQPATLAASNHQDISRQCFGCMCEAASQCDLKSGCHDDVCGPFGITNGYWVDSGKPTLNSTSADNSKAYEECVNDIGCAAKTVQGYMDRYAKDCDGDGMINCNDYVRIHRLGGYGCSGAIDSKYIQAYQSCMEYVNKM